MTKFIQIKKPLEDLSVLGCLKYLNKIDMPHKANMGTKVKKRIADTVG